MTAAARRVFEWGVAISGGARRECSTGPRREFKGMTIPKSAIGSAAAASWKTYSVSRKHKEPLLRFIVDALAMRDCRILHTSSSNRAPFYIVFETPLGERHGVLAYAFFANSEITNNRPVDEHRFQVKYGSELTGVLDVAIDPAALITTIFLGVDTERKVFVAADPLMNNPSPMSRSIEFKAHHVEEILANDWAAWERDRRPPKTRHRPTAPVDEDTRIQVLIGGKQERLLDLIQLERLARGLEPGERHLLADKLAVRTGDPISASISHKILDELSLPAEALLDLIDGASRLKMAVRGWVAETHLVSELAALPGISDCMRLDGDGQPDLRVRWKGGPPVLIECKNVLRKTNAAGFPRVDFQRTRASKEDPCSRYYQPTDFSVLAACLHAVAEEWRFSFALTGDLPTHPTCPGRISSSVVVTSPTFTEQAELVFDKCSSFGQ